MPGLRVPCLLVCERLAFLSPCPDRLRIPGLRVPCLLVCERLAFLSPAPDRLRMPGLRVPCLLVCERLAFLSPCPARLGCLACGSPVIVDQWRPGLWDPPACSPYQYEAVSFREAYSNEAGTIEAHFSPMTFNEENPLFSPRIVADELEEKKEKEKPPSPLGQSSVGSAGIPSASRGGLGARKSGNPKGLSRAELLQKKASEELEPTELELNDEETHKGRSWIRRTSADLRPPPPPKWLETCRLLLFMIALPLLLVCAISLVHALYSSVGRGRSFKADDSVPAGDGAEGMPSPNPPTEAPSDHHDQNLHNPDALLQGPLESWLRCNCSGRDDALVAEVRHARETAAAAHALALASMADALAMQDGGPPLEGLDERLLEIRQQCLAASGVPADDASPGSDGQQGATQVEVEAARLQAELDKCMGAAWSSEDATERAEAAAASLKADLTAAAERALQAQAAVAAAEASVAAAVEGCVECACSCGDASRESSSGRPESDEGAQSEGVVEGHAAGGETGESDVDVLQRRLGLCESRAEGAEAQLQQAEQETLEMASASDAQAPAGAGVCDFESSEAQAELQRELEQVRARLAAVQEEAVGADGGSALVAQHLAEGADTGSEEEETLLKAGEEGRTECELHRAQLVQDLYACTSSVSGDGAADEPQTAVMTGDHELMMHLEQSVGSLRVEISQCLSERREDSQVLAEMQDRFRDTDRTTNVVDVLRQDFEERDEVLEQLRKALQEAQLQLEVQSEEVVTLWVGPLQSLI
ncbi:hypothetical protein CYMTET_35760 [Cymbomonas tetramitiformis]|uniref:Uncharacterized protein n=1 Tax=Cymbomonas tetramitiformis TaxID=36881 RepID=A0AAE0F8L3_9CHLO|nr:hypothetical protein CYMTET_35760 [Cymbomonas tetramitiformis]